MLGLLIEATFNINLYFFIPLCYFSMQTTFILQTNVFASSVMNFSSTFVGTIIKTEPPEYFRMMDRSDSTVSVSNKVLHIEQVHAK